MGEGCALYLYVSASPFSAFLGDNALAIPATWLVAGLAVATGSPRLAALWMLIQFLALPWVARVHSSWPRELGFRLDLALPWLVLYAGVQVMVWRGYIEDVAQNERLWSGWLTSACSR
jgi:hypothetical protein